MTKNVSKFLVLFFPVLFLDQPEFADMASHKSCVATKCSPDTSSKHVDRRTKRSHSDSETDVLSDDSSEIIRKSKYTKRYSDSDDSISTEIVNKKACVTEQEEGSDSSQVSSLSRNDTDSPIFLDGIRKKTSEWTGNCLPNFRIETDTSVPANKLSNAYEVFTNGYLHFIDKKNKCAKVVSVFGSRSEEDNEISQCYKYAVHDVFTIDCYHIDDVADDDLKQIETELWIDNFVERITDTNQRNARERICRELSRHLKIFKWQLIYMLRRRRGNDFKEISEGMYQELFVTFAKIFGLKIVSGSNVEKYTLKINDTDIVAIPDGLICHPTDLTEDKICAVIEVKRYREDGGSDSVRDLRNTKKAYYAQHIGCSLKDQLGGQFICTLPYSVFGNNGMYGFLVQGTNVTLTSFKPEDGYYKNLCTGYLKKKGAVITYSKEYNILRKEDRKELVQTFLDMGKLLEYF